MISIKSKGTSPEATAYRMLRGLLGCDIAIECNGKSLPGSPDFYIPSVKVALFVHGCFWHRCPKHGRLPSSNQDYWLPKLTENIKRDRRVQYRLNKLGISVWKIWEHDLKKNAIESTKNRLAARFFKKGLPSL